MKTQLSLHQETLDSKHTPAHVAEQVNEQVAALVVEVAASVDMPETLREQLLAELALFYVSHPSKCSNVSVYVWRFRGRQVCPALWSEAVQKFFESHTVWQKTLLLTNNRLLRGLLEHDSVAGLRFVKKYLRVPPDHGNWDLLYMLACSRPHVELVAELAGIISPTDPDNIMRALIAGGCARQLGSMAWFRHGTLELRLSALKEAASKSLADFESLLKGCEDAYKDYTYAYVWGAVVCNDCMTWIFMQAPLDVAEVFVLWLNTLPQADRDNMLDYWTSTAQIVDYLVSSGARDRLEMVLKSGIKVSGFKGALAFPTSNGAARKAAACLRIVAENGAEKEAVVRAATTLALAAVSRDDLPSLRIAYSEFIEPLRHGVRIIRKEEGIVCYIPLTYVRDIFLNSELLATAGDVAGPRVLEWIFEKIVPSALLLRRMQLLHSLARRNEELFVRALAVCIDEARLDRTVAGAMTPAPSQLTALLGVVLSSNFYAAALALLAAGANASKLLASSTVLNTQAEKWLRRQEN